MPARCTAAALLALSASLQPPITRRAPLQRHASIDDAALLNAYRAEIAPDAADDWGREGGAATERPPRPAVRCVDAAAAAALRASTECEEIPWAPGRGYWYPWENPDVTNALRDWEVEAGVPGFHSLPARGRAGVAAVGHAHIESRE